MKAIITKVNDITGDFRVVTPVPFTVEDGVWHIQDMVLYVPKYEHIEDYNVFDLIRENKELKEKYKAVSKGLLKVSSKRNKWKKRYEKERMKNRELTQRLKIEKEVREKHLKKEIDLKVQLEDEENYRQSLWNDFQDYREEVDEYLSNTECRFIKWLEEKIKNYELPLTDENKNVLGYTLPIKETYKEVLSRYKEIIGVKND